MIKKFDEYGNEYFYEIKSEEFNKVITHNNYNFKELNDLKESLVEYISADYGIRYTIYGGMFKYIRIIYFDFRKKTMYRRDERVLEIYPYSDEWYIVKCYINSDIDYITYYKCDQYQGLIKFLDYWLDNHASKVLLK